MSIKDILVGLATRSEEDPACAFALAMAAKFDAQVTAIAYALEPHVPFSPFPEFTGDLMERHRSDAKKETEAACSRFVEAARSAGVRHEGLTGHGTLQETTLDFARRLRTSDLAILAQHQSQDMDRVGHLFAEAALFQSGRPMILVPRVYAGTFSEERILIAWDGSAHAARAVAAAMPLMSTGKEIRVFTVQERSKGQDLQGSELVRHLRLHNLNAALIERDDPDIAEAIIRESEQFRASLVVMGGYGHSRLREFVFGGATKLMLAKMSVPVLMAH